MKAFGLEIRKSGSAKNLFDDVDRVLSKAGIPPMGVSAEMQLQTVAHALQKMITGQRYFDVCTIDKCREVANIVIPRERRLIYSACHCLNYDEMLPDFRQNLIAMVLDDFRAILMTN